MGAMAGLVDRFNESVRRHDATFNADLLSDDVKLYGVPCCTTSTTRFRRSSTSRRSATYRARWCGVVQSVVRGAAPTRPAMRREIAIRPVGVRWSWS